MFMILVCFFFFFQAEDGIRDDLVTGSDVCSSDLTDLVAEKLITPKEAVLLVEPEALSQLLAPGFDQDEWRKIPAATRGLPASPGAASGQVVFKIGRASCRERGEVWAVGAA